MTECYNLDIHISALETEDVRKMEDEIQKIRKMVQLMLDMCDEKAVVHYNYVLTSIEAVRE